MSSIWQNKILKYAHANVSTRNASHPGRPSTANASLHLCLSSVLPQSTDAPLSTHVTALRNQTSNQKKANVVVTVTWDTTCLPRSHSTVKVKCAQLSTPLKVCQQLCRAIAGYYPPLSKIVATCSLGVVFFLTFLSWFLPSIHMHLKIDVFRTILSAWQLHNPQLNHSPCIRSATAKQIISS